MLAVRGGGGGQFFLFCFCRNAHLPSGPSSLASYGVRPSPYTSQFVKGALSADTMGGRPRKTYGRVHEALCNYEAKRHSPTCFGMQPNHGGYYVVTLAT